MTNNFDGLRVVSFESRRADEMEKLIERYGGLPLVAPSMAETPLSEAGEAIAFARQLITGEFDIVVFLTGVGANSLKDAVATQLPAAQFIEALNKTTVVARGPKAASALRKMGVEPPLVAGEPNTSRALLTAMDGKQSLEGKRIAIQEYGAPNKELLKSLQQRGANVTPVPTYRWTLPDDLTPLRTAIQEIVNGRVDISLFTSAPQIRNLLQVANEMGLEEKLRNAFRRIVIASIGPACSDAIHECGLAVDHEPDTTRMGNLVGDAARLSAFLLRRKRTAVENGVDTNHWQRVDMRWPGDQSRPIRDPSPDARRSTFLKACRGEATDYTPIWLMRQAGRFQRAYRQLRSKVSFLELCKTPELSAEVTLMAVETLAVDAAIIFADILLILEPIGVDISFDKGEGPRIGNPVRNAREIDRLRDLNPGSLQFVYDAVQMTRRALAPEVALIGFAGAPFTVASYAVEGGGSRNYQNTKSLIYRDPGAWHALMERLVSATTAYLNRQIDAGADALQLFDSWVGCLSPEDYREFVLPHMRTLIGGINDSTPVIHFGTGNPALLPLQKEAGGNVIGLDWRVDLAQEWEKLGYDLGVQGNLDPVALFAPPREIRKRAKSILEKAEGRPGHIFNLGHGILPGTPVDHVLELVDAVHELSRK